MPTDLILAMERKAAISRELKRQKRTAVLLIPLIIGICIVAIIMAIESPTFAAAVITTGLI
jgi:hypothetical protein